MKIIKVTVNVKPVAIMQVYWSNLCQYVNDKKIIVAITAEPKKSPGLNFNILLYFLI